MEALYLLIPLAVLVAAVIAWFFFWSVKSGQFEDLEGPAHAILMDDDRPQADSGLSGLADEHISSLSESASNAESRMTASGGTAKSADA